MMMTAYESYNPLIDSLIDSISYYLFFSHPSFSIGKLYDQHRTIQCLSGKRVLFFGDSVMEELVFDLAILISGTPSQDLSFFFNVYHVILELKIYATRGW